MPVLWWLFWIGVSVIAILYVTTAPDVEATTPAELVRVVHDEAEGHAEAHSFLMYFAGTHLVLCLVNIAIVWTVGERQEDQRLALLENAPR